MNEVVKIPWIKLRHQDFEIMVARFVEQPPEQAVVIRGDGNLTPEQVEKLVEAGFMRLSDKRTIYVRRGNSVQFGEITRVFPEARAVMMDTRQTQFKVRGQSPVAENILEPHHKSTELPASSVKDARKVNRFQVPYQPGSKLGTPISMVPINMAPALAKALSNLEAVHGPIDNYVANCLNMDLGTMANVLSPEQIDAIGLSMFASERGREYLLADQTGLGKGRVLAGLALAAHVIGRKFVFITEKANLFSDFWRDLKDIGADKIIGKPFLLNHKSRIIDVTSISGDLLFSSPEQKELRAIVKSKALPDGCTSMFTSYSQHNRAKSPKNEFLAAVAKDALVLVDEAHNAAGDDSNVGRTLDEALRDAWGILRSSATFARRASSLLAYPKVLPPSLRTPEAQLLLQGAGNALAEVLSEALVEDGVLIRREQDLSGVRIDIIVDEVNRERNIEVSDAVAPILAALQKLQRKVDDEIEVRNEECGNPEGKPNLPRWYSANFGSRLQPIMRQFMSALSVDHTVELCVKELSEGRKPVVVVEQTMESLMRELSGERSSSSEEEEDFEFSDVSEEIQDDEDAETPTDSKVLPDPPTFKDALKMMLDRILHMSHKVGRNDPVKVKVENADLLAQAEKISAMIDQIPQLSLSPIDDIRDRVEAISREMVAKGVLEKPWVSDEISARKTRVLDGKYVPLNAPDRNELIVGFNSGRIDMLVLTLAASTGLSLHASERVADQRQRTMILLQIPADITRFLQMLGRVNRRGQTSVPNFLVPSTGLPSQNRALARENKKLSDMSANVSANADNATSMDVQDYIDSLGNEVAQRMLEDQPRIAERLGIGMKGIDQETADQELYFINKLLSRLCFLKVGEQEAIFERLAQQYEDALKAMLSKGISPRGTRELEGQWKEISRTIYEHHNPTDGDVFGRAIDLVVMERTLERKPLSAATVLDHIVAARKRLADMSGNAIGPYFDKHLKMIKRDRNAILNAHLSARISSVVFALKDTEDNAVKRADKRLTDMSEIIGRIAPGTVLSVPGEEDERKTGIIVDVIPPEDGSHHLPGQWTIKFAIPGDMHIRAVSMATIMRDKAYEIHPTRPQDQMTPDLLHFDRAPTVVRERREFLMGNLVKAVAIASEVKAGSMVTWFDEAGERRRSVLVNKTNRKALLDRSSKASDVPAAKEKLMNRKPLFSNPTDRNNGLIVEKAQKGFQISLPMTKGGQVCTPAELQQFCQTFRSVGRLQQAFVSDMQIDNLLAYVLTKGVSLHFDADLPVPKAAATPPRPGGFGGPKRPAVNRF